MTSIFMGKQSEDTPFGESENVHLAMRLTLTHPAHFRPRVRQILDREYHIFSMDTSSQ